MQSFEFIHFHVSNNRWNLLNTREVRGIDHSFVLFFNVHNRRRLHDDGRQRKKRRGQVTGHEYRNYYGQP